ncbi:MAG: metallophosphoesterase [Clostridia bacterium]|nr:metallophosphoesterase [Clostridia bacterium]
MLDEKKNRALSFRPDGSFRILMVSDVHAGKGYRAADTIRALDALVENTDPDLVFLAGDVCGPGVIHAETPEEVREVLDGLSSPMEKRGIHWAHVFGNHDDNYGVAKEIQEEIYESYPHCLSEAGPADVPGVGNYALPIRDEKGERILWNLYALDSHDGIGGFRSLCGLREEQPFLARNNQWGDPIYFEQILWYWETSKKLEKEEGRKVPSLMFMHVPLPEHDLVTEHKDQSRFSGHHTEDVCCAPVNAGLFAACLQRGDVKGIYAGHDHKNDFDAEYLGVRLGYDGFLSYHACHDQEIRGGRLFELRSDDLSSFRTRMVRVRDVV